MTTAAPVVLDLETIQAAVALPAAVQAVEGAFRTLAHGEVAQPLAMGLQLPAGEVHVKAAHLGLGHLLVVKIATGFPGNVGQGLPSGDGLMVALDQLDSDRYPEGGFTMTLAVRFVIGVIGLLAAILTFFAAVLNSSGANHTYDSYDPPPREECVYGGGYQACQ